jgi:hypothetical protein
MITDSDLFIILFQFHDLGLSRILWVKSERSSCNLMHCRLFGDRSFGKTSISFYLLIIILSLCENLNNFPSSYTVISTTDKWRDNSRHSTIANGIEHWIQFGNMAKVKNSGSSVVTSSTTASRRLRFPFRKKKQVNKKASKPDNLDDHLKVLMRFSHLWCTAGRRKGFIHSRRSARWSWPD